MTAGGAERLRIVPFEPDIGNAFVGKRDAGHLAVFWTAGSALVFACCASLLGGIFCFRR